MFRINKRKTKGKKHKKNNDFPDLMMQFNEYNIPKYTSKKNYDAWNQIGETYLRYIDQIDGEDQYLTWRFSGNDLQGNNAYNLILLPYKNKQNEFKVHLKDYLYLKQFYDKYGMYNDSMKENLNKIVFATNEYNTNPEDYLELEQIDDTTYVIKGSIWALRGPLNYLHIDNKNKLYFDQGINQNIAKFTIE
jgi:hypothetical protein